MIPSSLFSILCLNLISAVLAELWASNLTDSMLRVLGDTDCDKGLLECWLESLVITIPDVSFTEYSIDGSITGLTCQNIDIVSVTSTTHENTVTISVGGLQTSCHGNWAYQESVWPHVPYGDGTVDVTVSNSGFSFTITYLSDGFMATGAQADDCNVDINTEIHFSGGFSGWIMELFSGMISDLIHSKANELVCVEFDALIDTNLTQLLLLINTKVIEPVLSYPPAVLKIPAHGMYDWEKGALGEALTGVNSVLSSHLGQGGCLDILQIVTDLTNGSVTLPVNQSLSIIVPPAPEPPLGELTLNLTNITFSGLETLSKLVFLEPLDKHTLRLR